MSLGLVLGLAIPPMAAATPLPVFASAPAFAAGAGGPTLGEALDLYKAPELSAPAARAVAAGVDSDLLAAVLIAARDAKLPAGDAAAILDQAARVADEGLPLEPVLGRYLQGFAKGVAFPRILAAASGVLDRLEKAEAHLAESVPGFRESYDEEIRNRMVDRAAYALEVGVEPEYLDRSLTLAAGEIGTASTDWSRAPVLALSFLVYAGVDSKDSFDLVASAWDHGYRGDDLERLGETVLKLGQRDRSPKVIVDQVMTMIGHESSPDRLFRDLDALDGQGDGSTPPGAVPVDDPGRRRQVPGERPDQGINRGSNNSNNRGSPGQTNGSGH